MASLTNGSITLWVKPEPFTFGALPVPPHPRLSVHNIKKIVSYAKNKGKSGYPKLSYAVWKHIAVNKLQLPIDLAWMYFTQYDIASGDTSPEQRMVLDNKFAACINQQEMEELRLTMSVPTLKFVLFLYVQQLHKISLRASLLSGSDEWPTRARSPELEGGRSTTASGKILDEHGHMTFLLNNLNEIMELLLDTDSYSGGHDFNDMSLSTEAVEALGFLISGSMDNNRSVKPLHELALAQQMHSKSGYSKTNVERTSTSRAIKVTISRSFSFRNLQSWLRANIAQSPYGISSCLATGRRLSWPLAGEDKDVRVENKRGRIATNAHAVPKENCAGNKLIIMSQVAKQTVVRSSGTLEGSAVKIHRCHYSYIYLLSPLRSVSVDKCRNSTIVVGAVTSQLHVNHCDNCVIISTCRRLSVSGSTGCTFHTLTPLRPLVFSGNESLVFAPYHTHYPRLEEHMAKAGIGVMQNVWDQPLSVGPETAEETRSWEIMSARDFYTFTIPFQMDGPTNSIPCGLPPKFERTLTQRTKQIDQFQSLIKEAQITREQRKQFQSLVESRFQEWLVDSGHRRQLDTLVPMRHKNKTS